VPGGLRVNTLLSSLGSGHRPEVELLQKQAPIFFSQLDSLRQNGVTDCSTRTVLEVGTGWDLNVAILMSLSGFESVTTADAFRHLRFSQAKRCLELMNGLTPQIAQHSGRRIEDIEASLNALRSAQSLPEILRLGKIRYLAPVTPDYREIEDRTIDIAYTAAVLEHIRPSDVRSLLGILFRKLKHRGLTTHVIDLKDHFAYFDRALSYNHFLRFSESEWDRWAGNPMSYTNRISASQWKDLFLQNGFEILTFEEIEERSLQPLPSNLIHPSNRGWNERDLKIGEIRVTARVP
jgi:hypothetical protein